MKVLLINSVYENGSTGRICRGIESAVHYSGEGICETLFFWGEGDAVKCSNIVYQKYQSLKSRVTGKYGFTSSLNTLVAINKIKKFGPDIIHLHNIHDHTLNVSLLFKFLQKQKIKTVWTLHDCWAFTGYCCHFGTYNCSKWMDSCDACPAAKDFSWFRDCSNYLFLKKQSLQRELDIIYVTPSVWLKSIAESSYLKEKEIRVINNGIDLNVFKPTESSFREVYDIQNKYVLLGVAFDWSMNKGLETFIQLSSMLDNRFIIVLVGLTEHDIRNLPSNIIGIKRTKDQTELAQLYTMANVFINPTREDTFPTVNIEALACGTPVITFNIGGSPEIIDETCGCVLNTIDESLLKESIEHVCIEKPFSRDACVRRALKYRIQDRFLDYVRLYKEILEDQLNES